MDRRTFLTSAAVIPLAGISHAKQAHMLTLTEQMQHHTEKLASLAKQSIPADMALISLFLMPSRVTGEWETCVVAEDNGEGLDKRTGYLYPARSDKWRVSTRRELNIRQGI